MDYFLQGQQPAPSTNARISSTGAGKTLGSAALGSPDSCVQDTAGSATIEVRGCYTRIALSIFRYCALAMDKARSLRTFVFHCLQNLTSMFVLMQIAWTRARTAACGGTKASASRASRPASCAPAPAAPGAPAAPEASLRRAALTRMFRNRLASSFE